MKKVPHPQHVLVARQTKKKQGTLYSSLLVSSHVLQLSCLVCSMYIFFLVIAPSQLLSCLSDRGFRPRLHCSLIGYLAFKSCLRIRSSLVGPLLRARSHKDPHLIVMGYTFVSEIILDVLVMAPCMCTDRAYDLLYCHYGNI